MGKQPKSTIESMPMCMLVTLIFQFLLFSPELISTIKGGERLSDIFKSIFTDVEDHLYLYGFTGLILIFAVIHMVYTIWKNAAMKYGVKHSGKITESISGLSQVSRRSTSYYRYKVELEDGQVVFTKNYLDNEIERLNLRSCTVYEYKGKFVFCDFK